MARQAWAVDKSSYLERLRINSADHVWAVELEGTAMACYAVCDCERHNGAVWLKRDKIVHVYACPLKFAPHPSADNTAAVPANDLAAAPAAANDTAAVPADDPAAALPAADDTAALPAYDDDDADAAQSAASQYLYICDCDGMSRVGEKLAHLGDVSSMTRSECIAELGGEGAFCQHSVALATLIAERRVPDPRFTGSISLVADLIAVPCDVPVTVLESSPSPLLSCAFTEEGPTVPATRVVIGVKKHTFVCFTCPEHLQARCDRVRMLHELTMNLKADVGVGVLDDHHFAFDPLQRDGVDSDSLIGSVSYETIPELIVNQVFKDRVGALDAAASLPKACIPPAEGSPSRPTCECGAPWGNETVEVPPSGGATITNEWTTKCIKVYDRCCSSYPSCPGRLPYDGQPDAVFNLSNHSLYAYELAASCKTFRRALKAFMRLLRVEHVFECPCCEQLPHSKRIIIMDGTCLGFRRDLFRFLGLPMAHGGVVPIWRLLHNAYYIASGPLRKAMLQYCASGMVGDLTAAIKLARGPGNPRALPLVLELIKAEGAAKYDPYRCLLKAVSIDYPLRTLVSKLGFPAGDHLLKAKGWTTPESIPAAFQALWKELDIKATGPKSAATHESHAYPEPVQLSDAERGLVEKVSFSPALQVLRHLRTYAVDGRGSTADEARDEVPSKCTKHADIRARLTYGIFAMFCPHGFCLGFEIMSRAEGPRTAHNMIFWRFSEAPYMVIYDNSCNLDRYVLLREPAYYDNGIFMVDRMHIKHHVNCHEGYNLSKYPGHIEMVPAMTYSVDGVEHQIPALTLEKLNLQAAEQVNSQLDRIKKMCAYMGCETFMDFASIYLHKCNLAKLWSMGGRG
ncbi:hypothetical protein FOA52_006933 [Chlamydomonas sp. UWO 241]|nr:hypothetical protein FOA52_006933 [Chlamydomonas sp. UWO 241]